MRKAALWIGLCLLVGGSGSVHAYDNDTHYVFTYFLARRVGFTPNHAHQIASGNVSTDYDSKVEPFQIAEVIDPWGDAQTPRFRFHAFPDSRTYDKIKSIQRANGLSEGEAGARATEAALDERDRWQAILWQRAKASGNPGLYLHFYQDIYSHDGFSTRFGHGPPATVGHGPDFLSYKPEKARAMMLGTVQELQRFMHECLPREPLKPDLGEAQQVLDQFIAISPHSRLGSPDWKKALDVVNRALGSQGGAPKEWTVYHFDAEGNPLSTNWKLEGSREPLQPGRLWVKVVADETGEPLGGAKVAVTFAGKSDVLAGGTTAEKGQPPLDLAIASSGRYDVQATLPGYGTATTTVEMPFEGSAIGVLRMQRSFDWTGRWRVWLGDQPIGKALGILTFRKVDPQAFRDATKVGGPYGQISLLCPGNPYLGEYDYSGGGKVTACVMDSLGYALSGRYKDTHARDLSGEGNFIIAAYGDPYLRFQGTFVPAGQGKSYAWNGVFEGP